MDRDKSETCLRKEIIQVLLAETPPQISFKKWALNHANKKADELIKVFKKYNKELPFD